MTTKPKTCPHCGQMLDAKPLPSYMARFLATRFPVPRASFADMRRGAP